MRTIFFVILALLYVNQVSAQQSTKIYDPEANAQEEINQAIAKAKAEGKHVILQVGGNWCSWCIKLHNFCDTVAVIDSIMQSDYVWLAVNYSRDNQNKEVMARLDYPQRFGFPVLVILDGEGNRLHTQDSGLLEEDNLYSKEKVTRFLLNWNTKAISPASYTK